jgi:hypothetical protein
MTSDAERPTYDEARVRVGGRFQKRRWVAFAVILVIVILDLVRQVSDVVTGQYFVGAVGVRILVAIVSIIFVLYLIRVARRQFITKPWYRKNYPDDFAALEQLRNAYIVVKPKVGKVMTPTEVLDNFTHDPESVSIPRAGQTQV